MKKHKMLGVLTGLFLLSFGPSLLAQHTLVDNRIPIDLLDTNGNGYVQITAPGSYFLRDTLFADHDGDAITIDSDNVTLDLNGFAVIAGPGGPDDGIWVSGNHNNITVKNGTVTGFGGNGINAVNADRSTFSNLIVKDNEEDGLVADYNCLIINCTAMGNGLDGLDANVGSIIQDCTAAFNGDNGIQTSSRCMVHNCTSYGNETAGISVADGCRIEYCTVYDNAKYGLDIDDCVLCLHNTVYRNGWLGITALSSGLIMHNVCNDNGVCIINGTCGTGTNGQGENTSQGAGIRVFANVSVRSNQCSGNYFGIVISSVDVATIGNHVQNNRHAGILGTNSGSLFIKNTAEGNGFEQAPGVTSTTFYLMGDIVFPSSVFNNSSIAPIIDVSGIGDISTVSGATHPFANFVY